MPVGIAAPRPGLPRHSRPAAPSSDKAHSRDTIHATDANVNTTDDDVSSRNATDNLNRAVATTPTQPRRRLSKEARRATLIAAAEAVFSEIGYSGATMEL